MMKKLFPQYYRHSEVELLKLLKECIFIFDTNVLLNLYRYPRKAREDLFKIINIISEQDRLWLPFHVALEYQAKRLSVIADQKTKFGQVKKVIADIKTELQNKLDNLQLKKRHSSIDPDVLIEDINKSFDKYIHRLELLNSEQSDVYQEDKIRSEIERLFKNNIGKPYTQSELEDIFEEGIKRYQLKIPPGFGDAKDKKDTYVFHEDLIIKREYGDLIIWKEILKYVADNKPKGIIYITDDNKEDWWFEISGKKIGPRPELLSEIKTKAGLSAFHMYNSENFMDIATKYLKIEIERDSIEQVKMTRERLSSAINRKLKSYEPKILLMYNGKCQVCGSDENVMATRIKSKTLGGSSRHSNLLVLCSDHYDLFRSGIFSISDDFMLIGIDGSLTVHPKHMINKEVLKHHRNLIYRTKSGGSNKLS